jgi:DNA-binding beta-propeller fold protein YncE
MRSIRLAAVAGSALAVTLSAAFAAPASAHADSTTVGAVFVQNDSLAGNAVIAYRRTTSGALEEAGSYATGGLGGQLGGAVVDHVASQGALGYDQGLLAAVNAGSDTITTFDVQGDQLVRRQVLPSGGSFPVSIAMHGDMVYVLNARDGGSLQGYRRVGDQLVEVPAWHRDLGLNPDQTPEVTSTPGQVGFSPDGQRLVVTTKNGSNSVLVYDVSSLGLSQPVVTELPGTVPFGFSFDQNGVLVLSEAATGTVATFRIGSDRHLVPLDSAATGQKAPCWIAIVGDNAYSSNTGSASVSGYRLGGTGSLTDEGVTPAGAGTVDAAGSPDGRFLYVETGAVGGVDAFRVGTDGALTKVGSVIIPDGVGAEGIVVR